MFLFGKLIKFSTTSYISRWAHMSSKLLPLTCVRILSSINSRDLKSRHDVQINLNIEALSEFGTKCFMNIGEWLLTRDEIRKWVIFGCAKKNNMLNSGAKLLHLIACTGTSISDDSDVIYCSARLFVGATDHDVPATSRRRFFLELIQHCNSYMLLILP